MAWFEAYEADAVRHEPLKDMWEFMEFNYDPDEDDLYDEDYSLWVPCIDGGAGEFGDVDARITRDRGPAGESYSIRFMTPNNVVAVMPFAGPLTDAQAFALELLPVARDRALDATPGETIYLEEKVSV
jgi:hypothetical protein